MLTNCKKHKPRLNILHDSHRHDIEKRYGVLFSYNMKKEASHNNNDRPKLAMFFLANTESRSLVRTN